MRQFLAAIGLVLALALGVAQPSAAERNGLAVGLAGISDWSPQLPFVDHMKSAREWIGHRRGQWGGVSYEELKASGVLDAAGWPREIPAGLRGIGTVVLTDLPVEARSSAGRYRLRYEGTGIVEVSGRAERTRYGDGEVWFEFTPGPGSVTVTINRTDPSDPVRELSLVREDQIAAHEAGELFNPDWLARIGAFGLYRYMDWMKTNHSALSAWDERPEPGDFSYVPDGVPVELMVALANQTGTDPWFTLPHLADDTYFRNFAEYVRDHLDPGLTAHVEYSNEMWNWGFAQTRWAEEEGRQRWGRQYSEMQVYGMRAAEMAMIWRDVFGAEADERLKLVIATQTGWLGREVDVFEAPLWVAEDPDAHPAPHTLFDAYAVTGYFGHALGVEKADAVRGWLDQSEVAARAEAERRGLSGAGADAHVAAHRFDLATELALADLKDGRVTGDPAGSLAQLLGELLPYQAAAAARHGLELVMYEGGTHVVGVGAEVDDDRLTAFFTHLNYTAGMGGLYRQLILGWQALGGGPFNLYSDVYRPVKWGSWGLLRHLDDDNPRWRAVAGLG